MDAGRIVTCMFVTLKCKIIMQTISADDILAIFFSGGERAMVCCVQHDIRIFKRAISIENIIGPRHVIFSNVVFWQV